MPYETNFIRPSTRNSRSFSPENSYKDEEEENAANIVLQMLTTTKENVNSLAPESREDVEPFSMEGFLARTKWLHIIRQHPHDKLLALCADADNPFLTKVQSACLLYIKDTSIAAQNSSYVFIRRLASAKQNRKRDHNGEALESLGLFLLQESSSEIKYAKYLARLINFLIRAASSDDYRSFVFLPSCVTPAVTETIKNQDAELKEYIQNILGSIFCIPRN